MQTLQSSAEESSSPCRGCPPLPGSAAGRWLAARHVGVPCHQRRLLPCIDLPAHKEGALVPAAISLPFALWCHLAMMTTFKWCQVQSVELYKGWVTCLTNSLCCTIFRGCLCALPQVHDFLWHWKLHPADWSSPASPSLQLFAFACFSSHFYYCRVSWCCSTGTKERACLYQVATDTPWGILLQIGLTFFSNTFCKLKSNNFIIQFSLSIW